MTPCASTPQAGGGRPLTRETMAGLTVHLLGCRGSTPATGADHVRFGGDTSCVALAAPGHPPQLLLDLGTGAANLARLTAGGAFRGTALLTHLHWDHTHGIPFARALDHPAAQVAVLLPDQGRPAAEAVADVLGPPHFPITPAGLRGDWSFEGIGEGTRTFSFGDATATVTTREIPHKGGRTFGYRIAAGGVTVAYLPDHHPGRLGPGADGFGELHEAALALAANVDLLIHDAQWLAHEYADRRDFGHSAVDYAVALGAAAAVGQVLLFHHDPSRRDDELDAIAQDWSGRAVAVAVARQGDTVTLCGRSSPHGTATSPQRTPSSRNTSPE